MTISQERSAESAATAGERFARALAAKDSAALRAVLADAIDFQALTPGADCLVEQQAYYDADAGRITWMRVLCSGYLPAG